MAAVQAAERPLRLTRILDALGSRTTWYRRADSDGGDPPAPAHRSRRGPKAQDIPAAERHVVLTVAWAFPWYGYKKVGLICQRLDEPVPRRRVYRILKEAGLLHQRRARLVARARQDAAKLYELLPKQPNELWQTDVTYLRIPGYGWWYAIPDGVFGARGPGGAPPRPDRTALAPRPRAPRSADPAAGPARLSGLPARRAAV